MEGRDGGFFDLEADIGETKDLSEQNPDPFEAVQERYRNWLSEMAAVEPRGPFRDF